MGNMSKTEIAYFKAARAMSELSDHPHHHLGCVVVKGHKIISSGFNSVKKCDPIQARLDKAKYGIDCPGRIHAEVSALLPFIKNRDDISGASIYVYRQLKNGTPAMARPCSTCEAVIRSMGIKKIYYSNNNGYCVEKW